jgi:hypothetical protein
MATNYPGSLDAFVNPASGNTLDSPSHSLQHSDINDAVEAIETKLGAGSATPGTATAYFPLVAGTAGATSWTQLTAAGITSGTATSGQVLAANGSGAAAWSTLTPSGLTEIVPTSVAVGSGSGSSDSSGKVTFSGASSVSLNGVFTSTNATYVIYYNFSSSAATLKRIRLRSSGTDNTSSNYNYQILSYNSATVAASRSLSDNNYKIENNNNNVHGGQIVLINPFDTEKTFGHSRTTSGADGTLADLQFALTTSFDGFTIYMDSGTMTGILYIYGYRS